MDNRTKEIWLAGGCFWGLQKYLGLLDGVVKTQAGYANGKVQNPTYKQVCAGGTGFAEAVYTQYRPDVISLRQLLSFYFDVIDPTELNRQGGDIGEQYRTGIYYTDPADLAVIQAELARQQLNYSAGIVTEVKPLENFYPAEEYHQEYLDKNPGGYCHISAEHFSHAAETHRFAKPTAAELKQRLTPLQYEVTQNNATEPPFDNAYNTEFREGIYVDVTTGEPLFMSASKFSAGCGWPAFSQPIRDEALVYQQDNSTGAMRTEVRSRFGNAHLGHMFNDGPPEKGGLRYCINSAALRFIPKESMEQEGYKDYLPLLGPEGKAK